MALMISDTLVNVSRHIRRHIRKSIKRLPDNYIVRSPYLKDKWAPDLIIESNERWLNMTFVDDIESLFNDSASQLADNRVELVCQACSKFGRELDIKLILVIWQASDDDISRATSYLDTHSIVVVSRSTVESELMDLFDQQSIFFDASLKDWFKAYFFPESEIPAACTTRQISHRDSNAQLSRFFLDYDQEWAAKLDLLDINKVDNEVGFSVRLINGVAGSGKTLIIVNRALDFCLMYPDRRVLLLIYNKPVIEDIIYRIKKHWGKIPKNLEILRFYQWSRKQWLNLFSARSVRIEFGKEKIVELIAGIRQSFDELKISNTQLYTEVCFIDEHLFYTEDAYLNANRAGRGFSLRSKERALIWMIYEKLTPLVTNLNSIYMHTRLIKDACLKVNESNNTESYHQIIIDEAQFFSPSWFELVKSSIKDGGQLYMCADPNQGFLKSRLSWKSLGISVIGRTKKLRKSYRTTRRILEAANKFAASVITEDPEEYLVPDYSNMTEGVKPFVIYYQSAQDMIDRTVNEAAEIISEGEIPANQILILYTGSINPWGLKKQLDLKLGKDSVWWFYDKKFEPDVKKNYLKMAQLESATGLEGAITFVLGIESVLDAHLNLDLNDDEQKEIQYESMRKLYMAMTRAGQRLIMFSSTKIPSALEALVDCESELEFA